MSKLKVMGLVLGGILLLLIASVGMSGCGGSSEAPKSDMTLRGVESRGNTNSSALNKDSVIGDTPQTLGKADGKESLKSEDKSANGITSGDKSSPTSFQNAILAQRKVIRNANLSIEVPDFDKAYSRIKTIIKVFGYVQESNIKKDKAEVNGAEKLITSGTIVIRVNKDKFDDVMTDIKGVGTLLEESSKGDDVTDKFFDTESRLRLLKYEESRLEDYLKKISDPDVIFKTESRLTDIRHEIESLTGTLQKWSDLVELSTITISIYEKGQVPKVDNSYFSRLSGTFLGSLAGVGRFFAELILVLAGALPALVIIGILAFVGFKAVKRHKKKKVQVVVPEVVEDVDLKE
ncbi:MAG TPA: DUF4349 domain-containing protein [Clostridia bacterium]